MRYRFIILTVTLLLAGTGHTESLIEQQRALFRAHYPDAELGTWKLSAEDEQLLKSYVLWPDLRAAYLRAAMKRLPAASIEQYLATYGTLKPARELRYRYALYLAQQNRLGDYAGIYREYYQGLELPKLDCLALQAEIAAGRKKRVVNIGSELWLVGKSQVDECDPVFAYLRKNGSLDATLYRERFDLAIADRSFSLARYLARSLDEPYRDEAALWLKVSSDVRGFVRNHDRYDDSTEHRQRLQYAIERTAMRDPQSALELWRSIETLYAFDNEQRNGIARHLALWSARRHQVDAAQLLRDLNDDAVDVEVLRWRARTALGSADWDVVVSSIEAMGEENEAEEWQYWLGIALRKTGAESRGTLALQTLAQTRGYYGFLAADEVGAEYAFAHAELQANQELLESLRNRESLIRARELFYTGLEGRGRSEWDAAISFLSQEEMQQAAILAHGWGWHSRAIATAARTGSYDDLSIRYPLPWEDTFERHASAARLRKSWAFGIARSESLFMRDIRSHAGAIGLMQLMPSTGRATAKEVNQPYAGVVTLTDPESNIRLGTTYLAKMYDRFSDNYVLATAAYNAGPLNVEAWLPESGQVDARIWIENIPYNETRAYVRRVMSTDSIFHWRLTGQQRRLSEDLVEISPGSSRQVAQTD